MSKDDADAISISRKIMPNKDEPGVIILKGNPISKDFGNFGIWASCFDYLDYIKVLETDLGNIRVERPRVDILKTNLPDNLIL
ncbi:hypothetical protein L6452_41996 [Arctium lappa]|uniref:Uncharacterized protein n=1 Tax=Arctium lappa TaxID=4217 RepID=A0ACB8XHG2_ARCLA|nr:hypothetical protein L6452_41996 [Arctium lappa]